MMLFDANCTEQESYVDPPLAIYAVVDIAHSPARSTVKQTINCGETKQNGVLDIPAAQVLRRCHVEKGFPVLP